MKVEQAKKFIEKPGELDSGGVLPDVNRSDLGRSVGTAPIMQHWAIRLSGRPDVEGKIAGGLRPHWEKERKAAENELAVFRTDLQTAEARLATIKVAIGETPSPSGITGDVIFVQDREKYPVVGVVGRTFSHEINDNLGRGPTIRMGRNVKEQIKPHPIKISLSGGMIHIR